VCEREKKKAKMIWVPGHTQEATCLGLSGGVVGGARSPLETKADMPGQLGNKTMKRIGGRQTAD